MEVLRHRISSTIHRLQWLKRRTTAEEKRGLKTNTPQLSEVCETISGHHKRPPATTVGRFQAYCVLAPRRLRVRGRGSRAGGGLGDPVGQPTHKPSVPVGENRALV